MIVLDASALYPIAKLARSEAETVARKLLQEGVAILDLTLHEVVNAAIIEARRGLVKDVGKVIEALATLARYLELVRIEPKHLAEIAKVATELRLTAYDAAYIYFARLMGAKLVTSDREILEKARDVAIETREWLKNLVD